MQTILIFLVLLMLINFINAQYNTTQYNTTQYNTTQYNTTQYNTTQYNTTQYNTTQHNTTQYNTTQYNTTQYNFTYIYGKLNFPVKAVYIDYVDINWFDGSVTVKKAVDAGFNMIILCFWTYQVVLDIALVWNDVSYQNKIQTMLYAHSKGAVVLVAAGGQTEIPYSTVDSRLYGEAVGDFSNSQFLDGIVFDFENFNAGLKDPKTGNDTISWLIDVTNVAREKIGPQKIIAHAPQAPYFSPLKGSSFFWSGFEGGYSAIENRTSEIDYYLIQYYNQGYTCYTTFTGIFQKSSSDCPMFPGTSIFEISTYGIPLYKLTNGKFTTLSDGANGWVNPIQLGVINQKAVSEFGWNSGISIWLWRNNLNSWLSSAWPFNFNNSMLSEFNSILNISYSINSISYLSNNISYLTNNTITNSSFILPTNSEEINNNLCSIKSPCTNNYCCSIYGYCGITLNYCGKNCLTGCTNGTTSEPTIIPTPSLPPTTSTPTTLPTEFVNITTFPPTLPLFQTPKWILDKSSGCLLMINKLIINLFIMITILLLI
jgi:hypothetical protein